MVHTGRLRNMASIYLKRDDKLLLLFRQGKSIVSNLWIGSAGGHFEEGEVNDAKACMLRELREELSITEDSLKNLSLRYVTLRYTDGEIRQNYYFFADLNDDTISLPQSTEGIMRWVPLGELKDLLMPFTARYMIDHYVNIGQFDEKIYGGLADKQTVYFQEL